MSLAAWKLTGAWFEHDPSPNQGNEPSARENQEICEHQTGGRNIVQRECLNFSNRWYTLHRCIQVYTTVPIQMMTMLTIFLSKSFKELQSIQMALDYLLMRLLGRNRLLRRVKKTILYIKINQDKKQHQHWHDNQSVHIHLINDDDFVQNAPGPDSIPFDKFDCVRASPYHTVQLLEDKLWRVTFSCEHRYSPCLSLFQVSLSLSFCICISSKLSDL